MDWQRFAGGMLKLKITVSRSPNKCTIQAVNLSVFQSCCSKLVIAPFLLNAFHVHGFLHGSPNSVCCCSQCTTLQQDNNNNKKWHIFFPVVFHFTFEHFVHLCDSICLHNRCDPYLSNSKMLRSMHNNLANSNNARDEVAWHFFLLLLLIQLAANVC